MQLQQTKTDKNKQANLYNKTKLKTLMIKSVKKIPSKIKHPIISPKRTFGQKAADILTKFAGSWTFIILFGIVMLLWIIANTSWLLFGSSWDPYPFILLNFVLSTLAALQAPIILMSQNRQTEQDRIRAEYDYSTNRRAEREIRQIKKILERIERRRK